jgi:hypothetical protein
LLPSPAFAAQRKTPFGAFFIADRSRTYCSSMAVRDRIRAMKAVTVKNVRCALPGALPKKTPRDCEAFC